MYILNFGVIHSIIWILATSQIQREKRIRLVLNIVEYIKTKPHEQNFAIRVGTNFLKLVPIRYFVTSLSLIFQQPKLKVKHCELWPKLTMKKFTMLKFKYSDSGSESYWDINLPSYPLTKLFNTNFYTFYSQWRKKLSIIVRT